MDRSSDVTVYYGRSGYALPLASSCGVLSRYRLVSGCRATDSALQTSLRIRFWVVCA
jgi:hypothetical protein